MLSKLRCNVLNWKNLLIKITLNIKKAGINHRGRNYNFMNKIQEQVNSIACLKNPGQKSI